VTPQVAQLFNLPVKHGLLVQRVDKNTAAKSAGIVGGSSSVVVQGESYQVGGDVITQVDGQPVTNSQQLFYIVLAKQPGDKIKVVLWRKSSKRTITVTLGARSGP
jgi:S1-C subfamily serine protease